MTIKPRMGQAYPLPGRMLAARNADLPAARRMEFRMGTHLGEVQLEGERLFGTGVTWRHGWRVWRSRGARVHHLNALAQAVLGPLDYRPIRAANDRGLRHSSAIEVWQNLGRGPGCRDREHALQRQTQSATDSRCLRRRASRY